MAHDLFLQASPRSGARNRNNRMNQRPLSTGRRSLLPALLIALWLMLPLARPVVAAPLDLKVPAEGHLHNEQQHQQIQEQWRGRRQQLLGQIDQAHQEQQALQRQLRLLDDRLALARQQLARARQDQQAGAELRTGLRDWLMQLLDRLEQYQQQSLPFLAAERQQRLERLRQLLADDGQEAAEPVRRILEALQIEARYGQEAEAYPQQIELAGELLQVEILRLGRLALFFRSPDGSRAGVYDPLTRQFQQRTAADSAAIDRALRQIRREAAPQLVALPLGRIERP